MNLGIISLGCAKNLVDTEMFLGLAKEFNLKILHIKGVGYNDFL